MPTIGASESFLQEAAQNAVKPFDLERQEMHIKVESSRRERLLTPIIETDERRESSTMLNSSSRSTQVKVEPLFTIELPDDDDDDILEIMTRSSLFAYEVVNISDDEDAGGNAPPQPTIITKTPSTKRKAMRKTNTPSKSAIALLKHSSTPISSIKKKAILNSIAQTRTLPKTTPNNEKKSSNETAGRQIPTINRAPSTSTHQAAVPPLLPQNTAEEGSSWPRQTHQNHNQFQQNINQFSKKLKIAVIDKGHRYGQIHPDNENLVVNAITECMLTKMNSDHCISPRFSHTSWLGGKCVFICTDMTTRRFLIETVAQLPQLWPGCSLAAVQHDGFRNSKRVRLILGWQVAICCPNFMVTLARQNPDLNVYDWIFVNQSPWQNDGDFVLDFEIDGDSYAKMCRNRGFVYFGFGRLLFDLYVNRPITTLTPFVKRMIYWNINGQFNVKSSNNI